MMSSPETYSVKDLRAIPFRFFKENSLVDVMQYGLLRYGLLRLEPASLVIEFEKRHSAVQKFLALLGDKPTDQIATIAIPLQNVFALEVRSYFFNPLLRIEVDQLGLVKDVPYHQAAAVVLLVQRRYSKDLKALVSRAMLLRSEINLHNYSA